jgi:hypothetical protein
MKPKNLVLSATLVLICFIAASAQDNSKDGNSMGVVDLPYDCAATNAIRFNPEAYSKLSYHEQRWVDIKWHKCQPKEKESDEQDVIIVNPVATDDDDKIFYGTISRKQLTDAREKCITAGAYGGVAISVAGAVTGNPAAAEIGTVVFNYSDVACSSLSGEIEKGNLLAILGPTQIVGNAVANKLTKDFINNIPIISGADKDNLKKLTEKWLVPPSVNVTGPNVTVSAGGASASLQKPRVVIGTPKLPSVTIKAPVIKIPRCRKIFGKKICR